MMDGRLKTLHPKVHGGILCRHDNPEDMQALAEHGILTFELVVVNLYPFEATVAREGVTMDEAIEQIDIGGPTLVRAAAKNHAFTTIATDAEPVRGDPRRRSRPTAARRSSCAAGWPARPSPTRPATTGRSPTTSPARRPKDRSPARSRSSFTRKAVLRYGENPHQQAAVYATPDAGGASVVSAAATARQGAFVQQPARSGQRAGDRPRQFAEPAAVRHQAQQPLRRGRGRHAGRGACGGRWPAIR